MRFLGCVDILLLLSRETLKSLEKLPETEFFLQNSVSFLECYVSEPIYLSLLSGYNEMSTEPNRTYFLSLRLYGKHTSEASLQNAQVGVSLKAITHG